jgi:hypothetical protein
MHGNVEFKTKDFHLHHLLCSAYLCVCFRKMKEEREQMRKRQMSAHIPLALQGK